MYLFIFIYVFFPKIINIFYENYVGNKCMFVCFKVFIFGNIIYIYIYMLIFYLLLHIKYV